MHLQLLRQILQLRALFARAAMLTIGLAVGVCLTPETNAATFTVDRTDDVATATNCDDATPNDCSLRGAILAANEQPETEANTINVPAGSYVLSQSSFCGPFRRHGDSFLLTTGSLAAPLCISKGNVTIIGAGAATTIIDGNQLSRVLLISADATVQISGVTIRNGLGDSTFNILLPHGGGIKNHGELTLTDTVVSANSLPAGSGGASGAGIYNAGVLTLIRTTVQNNKGLANDGGGGIYNEGFRQAVLTVSDSTISDNTIGANGGGICNNQGVVTIVSSTISDNTALNFLGGGVVNFGGNFIGELTVINSTISGNTSGSGGGGIHNSRAIVSLKNVTIANNTSGAAARGSGGGVQNSLLGVTAISLQNTLIAGNRDLSGGSPDCSTLGGLPLSSLGYNFIQNTANCVINGDTASNITEQNPQLDPLADNGGLTRTHALQLGSPAIDGGNPDAPGSGGAACSAIDQRGGNRLQDGNADTIALCDIGAFELTEGTGGFSLSGIRPNRVGNSRSAFALLYGSGFVNGMTVRLTRVGQPDIVGSTAMVTAGGVVAATSFDLTGRAAGLWDVVIRNPDGSSTTLPGGLTIETGGSPQLWATVVGPSRVRVDRASRYTVLFGNRGNVAAEAASLVIAAPADIALQLSSSILPPPPHPQQTPTDWSQVPVAAVIDNLTYISLVSSVLPAGFTQAIEVTVQVPSALLGQPFQIRADIGKAQFETQSLMLLVDGARSYAQSVLGVAIPDSFVPQLEQYALTQRQSAIERGYEEVVASAGANKAIYSSSQFVVDLAQFGVAQTIAKAATIEGAAQFASWPSSHIGQSLPQTLNWVEWAVHAVSSLFGPSEVYAASVSSCAERGMAYDPKFDRCLPDGCGVGAASGLCGGGGGGGNPVASSDPNDKVGPTGIGAEHFLVGGTPLPYAVFFENVETATAPAQEVVITDQLDGNKVDFNTFSFGSIHFGDVTVAPPLGLSQYSTTIDLRPANDLLVNLDARLDKNTGIVTWRFLSVDPLTGQFPDDPLAGFLPPNVNPPEGDGNVVFTVEPKTGVATGTQLCNQASIVFDVNAPILTPQWCNTIDVAPPSSAVQSLSAVQASSDFTVQWAGSDQGAGIADYTLFVSENGGPFTPWVQNTTELSALFSGQPGRTYAFYSIARDLVGNEEEVPAQPDTTTRVVGLVGEVCGNCVDDEGDGRVDWLDDECEAAELTLKKGVLKFAKPMLGDEQLAVVGAFAPASIDPPAEGVTLSVIQPGTGPATDAVAACVQIPPGAEGWKKAKKGEKWTFKDTREGALGFPDSKDSLTITYSPKKQQYELTVGITEMEVEMRGVGDVSVQLSIGEQGWENSQPWRLKGKGKQLVTP